MKTIDYSIYLCTDRDLMSTETINECVSLALKGGATVIQLREKNCSSREFLKLANEIKVLCKPYSVPLIINDRVDIALAVQAEGIHIGQDDIDAKTVRKLVGKDMIMGVSATNLAEAIKAEQDGADYIGVGAMFPTDTKKDAKHVSMEELCKIRESVNIPIVIIGGINLQTAPQFLDKGIDGLAIVSAIISKPDIEKATREFVNLWKG